ncbi:MAG: hypothetical protein IIT39_03330 [Clostridia bacterium]|nr:hypothetical protein [Clostridia bacterium]
MERFVERANLPESKVSEVIMSDYKPLLKKELEIMGIRVQVPKRLEFVEGLESYHADMAVCHLGGNRFFYADEIDETVTAKKPLLNVCIFGDNVICNIRKAYKPLIETIEKGGKRILHTNQSYAKCSCAVVGENAIITSDEGIYRVCIENKIDVLKISVGDIQLDGYDYGFIGGCCGFVDKNTLVFSGNVKLHKNYEDIKAFAGNYNVDVVSLSGEMLYDIGGILPVKEFL